MKHRPRSHKRGLSVFFTDNKLIQLFRKNNGDEVMNNTFLNSHITDSLNSFNNIALKTLFLQG
ncbi:hypothetical protein DSECCO2_219200 [anaerobic digester metagenome]